MMRSHTLDLISK